MDTDDHAIVQNHDHTGITTQPISIHSTSPIKTVTYPSTPFPPPINPLIVVWKCVGACHFRGKLSPNQATANRIEYDSSKRGLGSSGIYYGGNLVVLMGL